MAGAKRHNFLHQLALRVGRGANAHIVKSFRHCSANRIPVYAGVCFTVHPISLQTAAASLKASAGVSVKRPAGQINRIQPPLLIAFFQTVGRKPTLAQPLTKSVLGLILVNFERNNPIRRQTGGLFGSRNVGGTAHRANGGCLVRPKADFRPTALAADFLRFRRRRIVAGGHGLLTVRVLGGRHLVQLKGRRRATAGAHQLPFGNIIANTAATVGAGVTARRVVIRVWHCSALTGWRSSPLSTWPTHPPPGRPPQRRPEHIYAPAPGVPPPGPNPRPAGLWRQ